MNLTVEMWFGLIPLVGLILWFWYDIWYGIPVAFRCISDGTKLPPGYMGIPFLGEMLNFLWYFKFLRRPDDFINSRKYKYGDAEMFRTHLLGKPSIIAYSPELNNMVFNSETLFGQNWPSIELIGQNSLIASEGPAHSRLKTFVAQAMNKPYALRQIALMVQPRIITALHTWAEKGRVVGYDEAKKLTLENIGKYFAHLEPGPKLDILDEFYAKFVKGVRANPIKFPGTTYYKALQDRKKALQIFKEELDRRKKNSSAANEKYDLMEGLIQFRDKDGTKLSDDEVVDNMLALVVGGFESSAISITWALYYLAKYPHVLEKVRNENMLSMKNRKEDMITYDDILELHYTNKVCGYDINTFFKKMHFQNLKRKRKQKRYKIPKGWRVLCWLRYNHVNPEYFEDPLTFNPDRWDNRPQPGTYLVFGGGKRFCAGNKLARIQVAIFLHYLVLGYRWDLINKDADFGFLPNPKPEDGVEIAISKLETE
ncbi:OLC1v1020049C1 [Oldenlandia corymbosa var. corymbosa]|uniref:OLC1v1020049C1 n=1 Tax=Oldenlandia corymbosa var. corymbosa TaxID=529605 RepID=A0AAV1EFY5_OLDCO|nr:OLC1v1020049C1 [Oldenlandia corymbosa var. corymbosa]